MNDTPLVPSFSPCVLNSIEFIYKQTDHSSEVLVQATTALVGTVIVESTVIVEQKTLTTQFYLLLVESPLKWTKFQSFWKF